MQLGELLNDPSPATSSQGHPATMTNLASTPQHPATMANTVPREPFRGIKTPFQFPTTTASNSTGQVFVAPNAFAGHHGHNSIPREDGNSSFRLDQPIHGRSASDDHPSFPPLPLYYTNSGCPSSLPGNYSPTLPGPDRGPNNQGSLKKHSPNLSMDSQDTMDSSCSPTTSGLHSRLTSVSSVHSGMAQPNNQVPSYIPGTRNKVGLCDNNDYARSDLTLEQKIWVRHSQLEDMREAARNDILGAKIRCAGSTLPDPNSNNDAQKGGVCSEDEPAPTRKIVSQFFGRNKACTKLLEDHVWVIMCRKHYQRTKYRLDDDYPDIQAELCELDLFKFKIWSSLNEANVDGNGNPQGPVIAYWNVESRKTPSSPITGWVKDVIESGHHYTTDEVIEIMFRIRVELLTKERKSIPDIELLPTYRGDKKPEASKRAGTKKPAASHSRSKSVSAAGTARSADARRTRNHSLHGLPRVQGADMNEQDCKEEEGQGPVSKRPRLGPKDLALRGPGQALPMPAQGQPYMPPFSLPALPMATTNGHQHLSGGGPSSRVLPPPGHMMAQQNGGQPWDTQSNFSFSPPSLNDGSAPRGTLPPFNNSQTQQTGRRLTLAQQAGYEPTPAVHAGHQPAHGRSQSVVLPAERQPYPHYGRQNSHVRSLSTQVPPSHVNPALRQVRMFRGVQDPMAAQPQLSYRPPPPPQPFQGHRFDEQYQDSFTLPAPQHQPNPVNSSAFNPVTDASEPGPLWIRHLPSHTNQNHPSNGGPSPYADEPQTFRDQAPPSSNYPSSSNQQQSTYEPSHYDYPPPPNNPASDYPPPLN